MTCNLAFLFSTLFFASFFLLLPTTTISDDTCPYPCYPSPSGTGTPTVTTPSPPATPTGLYPPPAGVVSYPPPTGNNFPYYPPPSGNNFGYSPPPPDPILPYFPFYYRKPPHQTTDASSAQAKAFTLSISTLLIASVFVFACL